MHEFEFVYYIHTYIFDERNHHLVSQVGDLAEPQAYFLQARFLPLGVTLGNYGSAGIQGVDVGGDQLAAKGPQSFPRCVYVVDSAHCIVVQQAGFCPISPGYGVAQAMSRDALAETKAPSSRFELTLLKRQCLRLDHYTAGA